jgi:molybdate transport system substrate-binding protein
MPNPERVDRRVLSALVASLATAVFLGTHFLAVPAGAAEIKLLSTPAASSALREVTPQFERATGHRVLLDFANIAALRKRIAAGEAFDITIVSPKLIEELLHQGEIAAGTQYDIGRTGLGVFTRKGADKPDIVSVDAFKRALLAAKLVGYSATGESGIGFLSVLDRLGIAKEMKSKIKPADNLINAVDAGEVDFGITGVGATLAHQKLQYAGPLPADIQAYVSLAAGVSASAKEPQAARALLKYLSDPEVAQIMKSKGLEGR